MNKNSPDTFNAEVLKKKSLLYTQEEIDSAVAVFQMLIKWRDEEIANGTWDEVLALTTATKEKNKLKTSL
jgi:hypothetical protein